MRRVRHARGVRTWYTVRNEERQSLHPLRAAVRVPVSHRKTPWYRDTTLSWVKYSEIVRRRDIPLVTTAEFEPNRYPQIALVEPEAMRDLLQAIDDVGRAARREARRLEPYRGALVESGAALSRTRARRSSRSAVKIAL